MPTLVPSWALKLNYWYITNRQTVRYWLTIVFLAVDAILVLVVIILGLLTLVALPQRSALLNDTIATSINWSAIKVRSAPSDLATTYAVALPAADSASADMVAEVRNPNTTWYAPTLTYHWSIQGFETSQSTTSILPGQKKLIADFQVNPGTALSGTSVTATLVIDAVDWRRVSSASTYELPAFAVDDVTIESGSAVSEASVTGRITSQDGNTYREVRVVCVLFQGDTPVAVNAQTISRFDSFSERALDLRWFRSIPAASRVDVRADVDNLDPLSIL